MPQAIFLCLIRQTRISSHLCDLVLSSLWEEWWFKPENNHMTVRARHDFHTGKRWELDLGGRTAPPSSFCAILFILHRYSAVLQQGERPRLRAPRGKGEMIARVQYPPDQCSDPPYTIPIDFLFLEWFLDPWLSSSRCLGRGFATK